MTYFTGIKTYKIRERERRHHGVLQFPYNSDKLALK